MSALDRFAGHPDVSEKCRFVAKVRRRGETNLGVTLLAAPRAAWPFFCNKICQQRKGSRRTTLRAFPFIIGCDKSHTIQKRVHSNNNVFAHEV